MSKTFISFLGTGDYNECNYTYNGHNKNTSFVQDALIEFFCKGWNASDKIIIFMTEEARVKNWDAKDRKCLKTLLAHFGDKVHDVTIPIGKNEEEIWEIFNIVYEQLGEKDEVIFDVTHGFRSLPMLGLVILNYAQQLKDITVKDIFYGAYEAKDAEGNVPVFCLTQFFNLMRWGAAANAFVKYGISGQIFSLANRDAHHEEYREAKYAAKAIKTISEDMSTLRGSKIVEGKIYSHCLSAIKKIEESGNYQKPFKPVFEKVREKITAFETGSSMNFLYAVEWYINHEMYPQALTMMQEGLITYIMQEKSFDWNKREQRECVSSHLRRMNFPQKKWNITEEQKAVFDELKLSPFDELFKQFCSFYDMICNLRNDVNHGGFNEHSTPSNRIINQIIEYYNELCGLLKVGN